MLPPYFRNVLDRRAGHEEVARFKALYRRKVLEFGTGIL